VADLPALAPVLFGLWNFWLVRADLGRASNLAQQLEHLAQQQEEIALQGKAHTTAGQTDTLLGNFTAAFAHFQQGLAVYDEAQHGLFVREYGEDAGVSSHNVMGSVCWILGFLDQARHHLLAGRQLAQRLAYPFLLVQNLWRSAVVLQCCGATAEMEELLATLRREAQEMPFWHAGGLILHGWTVVERGQRERGITLMQQGMQAWRATGAEIARPYYLALLAHAYGLSDQAEAGLHSLEEALQLIVSTGERWWEAEIHRLRGALLLTQAISNQNSENLKPQSQILNPFSEAEASFLKAIAIAREQRAKSWELRAVMSLVRLRQRQALEPGAGSEQQGIRSQGLAVGSQEQDAHAKLAEAHRMLSEVYGWFTEGFDTKDLREAKMLLDSLVHVGLNSARPEICYFY
jgi:tetratricopeptide (TPR) repeat protein